MLVVNQLGQLRKFGSDSLQFSLLFLDPDLILFAGLDLFVSQPGKILNFFVIFIMGFLELSQLSFNDLPLSLCDFLAISAIGNS